MMRQAILAVAAVAALAGCSPALAAQSTRPAAASPVPAQAVAARAQESATVAPKHDPAEKTPWEYDVRNPQARGFAQGVVDCLHRKGVKYVEVNAKPDGDRITIGLGGPNNNRESITRGLQLIPQCEREVSAARR